MSSSMPPSPISKLNINDTLPAWVDDFNTHTGSTIAQLSKSDIDDGGGALIIMLRHTGCPFCAEILSDLKRALPELTNAGINPVIIHQAPESAFVVELLSKAGHEHTPRISDPDRVLYDLFGVKNGNPWQLFGPHVIWGIVRVLRKGLHPPRKKIGSLRRLNGSVFVQNSTLVARHNYTSQSDRADFNQLCALPA